MSVSCECCMSSGIGLCVGLIIRPEESCGVSKGDRESSIVRRLWLARVCGAIEKKVVLMRQIKRTGIIRKC